MESVAWITERKNVLSGFLYLSSLACYLVFAGLPDSEAPRRRRWGPYVGAFFLFCGALLSKSVTASLPAAILLILWWQRDRLKWRDVFPLIPFFCVGLSMGLTTAWLERHHVGAERVQWGLTPIDRVLIAGRAVCFYLGKLVWPHPLMFTYPRWRIDSHSTAQFLFPAAVLAGIGVLWIARKRLGKGPLVAALFFVGTRFPALGFIDVYPMIFSFVADHFQYLASIGPIVLISAAITRYAKPGPFAARATVAVCLLLPLGILTWRQGRNYRDLETLWRATLKLNDDAWMAHNNLGVVLYTTERVEESAHHFQRAIELNPQNPAGYNGLADARMKDERWDEAARLTAHALELDPTYGMSHYHLGLISDHLNRPDEAFAHYEKALELMPTLTEAHNDLAILCEQRGDADAAISHYLQAIDGFAAIGNAKKETLVHFNLAALLESRGQIDEAISHYRRAVDLKPEYGEAHLRLANLLFRRRQTSEAAHHYEEALRELSDSAQVHYNYGVALSNLKRLDEASKQFIEALRLQPDYLEARFARARLLELRGRSTEALHEYESILRDHPDHAPSKQRCTALRNRPTTSGPASRPSK